MSEKILKAIQLHLDRWDLLVALDVDSGWKKYFWFPGMRRSDFEYWWTQQASLTLTTELPGARYEAEASRELGELFVTYWRTGRAYSAFLDVDWSSFLERPDGSVILHRGFLGPRPKGRRVRRQ